MTIDPLRCTGRTVRQMREAPINAVFISCKSAMVEHDKYMAQKHGRPDLQIVGSSWLTSNRWQGLTLSGIVLDHALRLTAGERDHMIRAVTRIRNLV